jgi:predicted metal-dependent HD superfamily phosphohydrolase
VDVDWTALEPRWLALCADLAVDGAVAREGGRMLADAHGEPHRAYHGLTHLAECFVLTDAMADLATDERTDVELAIWFHDIVYDPRASDNELRSAVIAGEWLGRAGCAVRADAVRALIEMTAGHRVDRPTAAVAAVHDADLGILGAAPDRYREYARQIRTEYAHVPDEAYAAGRTAVLRGFLALEHLYLRPDVRAEREARARANLRAELATLGP